MEESHIKFERMDKASHIRLIALLALALVVILVGVIAWRILGLPGSTTPASQVETISAEALEERYGLRVRLIAVTAAGGMVDFRLKIVDATKAQQLLSNPNTMPRLIIPQSGMTLVMPPISEQELNLEDGGIYFILFPNSKGVVKPGTPVIVSFGEFQLEAIAAK